MTQTNIGIDLRTLPNNLIIFDGVCVLCNGFIQFVIRHDALAQFHLMTAQSKTGKAVYEQMGKNHGDYETFFFVINGVPLEKLDAVIAVMQRLGWPWRALGVFRPLPKGVKNWLYDRVARNRYRLFGKRDACLVPSAAIRSRFVD